MSFCAHRCVVMSLMRNNCHSWLTSDTMGVPVATVALQKHQRETHTTAMGKQLVEWEQSTAVINILVEVQAVTQKIYLQEGSFRERM